MKYLYFILISTQLLIKCQLSLLPFREHDQSVRKSHDFADPTRQDDFDENSLGSEGGCGSSCNCLQCNNTLPKPKKVINPYREQLDNKVPPKPFGSFCVKCAACLAVANQVQYAIENASQECETDDEKKKIVIRNIEVKINSLCKNGFKNFDLRSYGQHEILTDNFECTTHIASSMDGSWTKKLRELCTLYISRIHVESISMSVLDSMGNLTDILCRGTGILRDCVNIQAHENITMPPCKNCANKQCI